jgi:hypothetical protein
MARFTGPIGSVGSNVFGPNSSITGGRNNILSQLLSPATTSAIPQTVTKQKATQKDTTATTQNKATTSGTTQQSVAETARQSLPEEAMALLSAIIAGQKDPLIQLKDAAAGQNIQQLQQVLQSISPEAAATQSSGRLAELSRQLREQVLPPIFSDAELSGTGGNALAQLLAQDAAIRTGEAQSRVVEEARNTAIKQLLQGTGIQGQLTSGASGESARLFEALNILKGASETSRATTSEVGTTREAETGTTKETSIGSTTNESGVIDPIAWAKIAAELEALTKSAPNRSAQALAAFMAGGGDPARLSYRPRDLGVSQYSNQLLQNIQGLI